VTTGPSWSGTVISWTRCRLIQKNAAGSTPEDISVFADPTADSTDVDHGPPALRATGRVNLVIRGHSGSWLDGLPFCDSRYLLTRRLSTPRLQSRGGTPDGRGGSGEASLYGTPRIEIVVPSLSAWHETVRPRFSKVTSVFASSAAWWHSIAAAWMADAPIPVTIARVHREYIFRNTRANSLVRRIRRVHKITHADERSPALSDRLPAAHACENNF
jgi:hypothetical protein